MRNLFMLLFALTAMWSHAQTYELVDGPHTYSANISQTIRIPLKIRNTGDKSQVFVIRLAEEDLRATQKGYFCIDGDCMESGITEVSRKIDAGNHLANLVFVLETGIVAGPNELRFDVYVKGVGGTRTEYPVSINIDEKQSKNIVFRSKDIIVHDLYPNPVSTLAFLDYELLNEEKKAKIVIHNILGSAVGEQEMPHSETRAKISADELTPGIYFYTVYLENEGITTRKLIVRR